MSYYEQLRLTREARQNFYNSNEWHMKRNEQLLNYPLCVFCLKKGRYVMATVVDHIIDIQDEPNLRLDPDNFRSLCTNCHNTKTANTYKETGSVNGSIDFSILD